MTRMHRRWLCLSWLSLLVKETQTFSPRLPSSARSIRSRHGRKEAYRPRRHDDVSHLCLATFDDDSSSSRLPGEPKSQMNRFISDFLNKENSESVMTTDSEDLSSGSFTPSHLIALPLDACHELTIELESVQRAILYHAPVLVHACIAPAKMRLPLLYVRRQQRSSSSSSSSSETSRHLQILVQQVIDRHLCGSSARSDLEQAPDASQHNLLPAKPLLLEFAKLEIDGSNNGMLCTVAQPPLEVDDNDMIDAAVSSNNAYERLVALVNDLTETLQQAGYQTMLPDDNAQQPMDKSDDDDDDAPNSSVFRPRIPFMRLPPNWNELVRDNRNLVENRTTAAADDDDEVFIPSELGGNGISPIFWGKWMDDTFAKSIRMRQVAIYPRRNYNNMRQRDNVSNGDLSNDLGEDAFYLPQRFVELPMGNAALMQTEKEFDDYQDKRFQELEQQLEREFEASKRGEGEGEALETGASVDENDPLLAKTRDRLEKLFQQNSLAQETALVSELDALEATEAVTDTLSDDDEMSLDDILLKNAPPLRPEDPCVIDDWTRQRIRNIVSSRAKVQTDARLAKPKQKPAINDNTIFNKYKEGTLVPKQPQAGSPRELPPFPSREHVIGFWKIVRSPTGFDVEEGDESRSDNLVLRVDGTIAGGPILDQETRQKASGGTWKLLGTTADDARIRIRLVIPPKKERILVMEGKLERVSFSSDLLMARGTFGIPALEKLASKAENQIEDLLHCSGMVVMEDSITGKDKSEIGKFSITKLSTPTDPKQFTITVPKPVGFQD